MTDRERALREAAEIAESERAELLRRQIIAFDHHEDEASVAALGGGAIVAERIRDAILARLSTPDTSADGGERRESDEQRSKGQPSSEGATSRTRSPAGVSGIPVPPPMNTEGGTTKECLDGIHVFDGPPIQTVEALRGHVGSLVDAIPKDDEAWLRISLRLASELLWDSKLLDNADHAMDQAGNHIMLVSAGGSARQQLERRDREEARSYSDE